MKEQQKKDRSLTGRTRRYLRSLLSEVQKEAQRQTKKIEVDEGFSDTWF